MHRLLCSCILTYPDPRHNTWHKALTQRPERIPDEFGELHVGVAEKEGSLFTVPMMGTVKAEGR